MNLLSLLKQRFSVALTGLVDSPSEYLALIRPAGDPKFGDYQANCAMPLAKVLGKPAREIATEIVSKLDVSDVCHAPEIAGPGFINLKFKDEYLLEQFTKATTDDRLGVERAMTPQTVIIDYSSPNVAKPMHVGHLRSSVIGASLDKLFRFLGHQVTSDNHIGDWGTQFGMIIYGYKNFLDEAAYKANPVGELSRLYRLVNQLSDYHNLVTELPTLEAKAVELAGALEVADAVPIDKKDQAAAQKLKELRNAVTSANDEVTSAKSKIASVESNADLLAQAQAHPEVARLARLETAKLHQGDQENLALWQQFLPECLKAMDQVYDRLDIKFDMTLGESYYEPLLADVVKDLEQKGLAKQSQGAMCVFIEDNPAPFIVQKADGAYTYATTDLATIQDRVERLKANTVLYVVDARQSEHFQLLFKTAALWKYPDVMLKHISFGTVMGEDRKPYKTRSGDTVGLESLLDEAVTRAKQVIEENLPQRIDEFATQRKKKIRRQLRSSFVEYFWRAFYVEFRDAKVRSTFNELDYMQAVNIFFLRFKPELDRIVNDIISTIGRNSPEDLSKVETIVQEQFYAFRRGFGQLLKDQSMSNKFQHQNAKELEAPPRSVEWYLRRIVLEQLRYTVTQIESTFDPSKITKAEISQIAEAVGIGGIKYADLKHHRESDYVFNWDKMLAKKGDTATYMQYAYARISGIFRKGGIDRETLRSSKFELKLSEPLERALVIKLIRFQEILEDAAGEYRPNLLCQYLFETADLFSAFYDQHQVLGVDDEEVKKSRLLLCDMTARVMSQGLALLGIETIEQM